MDIILLLSPAEALKKFPAEMLSFCMGIADDDDTVEMRSMTTLQVLERCADTGTKFGLISSPNGTILATWSKDDLSDALYYDADGDWQPIPAKKP